MPVVDSPTLQRLFQQGEEHLSHEKAFLFDRVSLNIVSGTAIYTLPDYVSSIRRITWLGWSLDPLPQRNLREVFQSATQQSRPFWYVYNNVGLNNIQLFPCPMVSLAIITDLWNLAGSNNYQNACVVEFARTSDSSSFALPSFIRRQLLKQWVAKQVFLREGGSQNLKASTYFAQRWEFRKNKFFDLLDELTNKPRKLLLDEIVSNNYFPAPPMLPIDRFGTSVDEGQ